MIRTVNNELADALKVLHETQADVDQLQADLDDATSRRNECQEQLAYWQRVQRAMVKLDEEEAVLRAVPPIEEALKVEIKDEKGRK